MRRRAFAVALLALVAGACGDNGPSNAHVGTYTLQTVNGANLPFTLVSTTTGGATYKLEVTSASIKLSSNGTFEDDVTFREDDAGTVTTESFPDAGTYTLRGTSLSLRYSDGSTSGGSLSDGAITFTQSSGAGETLTAVYRK